MTSYFLADTAALTGRTLRHVTRSIDTIITTAVMPIAMMLLFVYVFGGAIDTGTVDYIDYMLPGILLITIASGISYTAFRLFTDMQKGIFERFQSMPIARSGLLWAHVVTSLVATTISLVIVIVVGFAMGFRTGAGPLAWLAVVGILVMFTVALTWLAVIPGLTATTIEGASVFAYPLIFLPFLSSAFVPTDTMPGPVRWFAENQPVTSIVDTIRKLFAEQPVGSDVWVALGWCVGLLVGSYLVAMATYRRKIALRRGGPAHAHDRPTRGICRRHRTSRAPLPRQGLAARAHPRPVGIPAVRRGSRCRTDPHQDPRRGRRPTVARARPVGRRRGRLRGRDPRH